MADRKSELKEHINESYSHQSTSGIVTSEGRGNVGILTSEGRGTRQSSEFKTRTRHDYVWCKTWLSPLGTVYPS